MELLLIVCAIVSIARIADFEDLSVLPWTLAAVGTCMLCLAMPFPWLRVFIAWIAVLIGMTVWNATMANRA